MKTVINNNSSSSAGISAVGLLGVLFVALKLLGYIDWSWWWVTAPFWGPLAIFMVVLLVFLVIWLITKA